MRRKLTACSGKRRDFAQQSSPNFTGNALVRRICRQKKATHPNLSPKIDGCSQFLLVSIIRLLGQYFLRDLSLSHLLRARTCIDRNERHLAQPLGFLTFVDGCVTGSMLSLEKGSPCAAIRRSVLRLGNPPAIKLVAHTPGNWGTNHWRIGGCWQRLQHVAGGVLTIACRRPTTTQQFH